MATDTSCYTALPVCESACTMPIDKAQISEVYDLLTEKVKKDLQEEYNCGRISGATYADAYSKLLGVIIQQTVQAAKPEQPKETEMDRCVKQAQCDLYSRKIEAYDDNKYIQTYDVQMRAWAIAFQDADLSTIADTITDEATNNVWEAITGFTAP